MLQPEDQRDDGIAVPPWQYPGRTHTLQLCLIYSVRTLKKNNQVCMVNGGIALWGPTRNIHKGATSTERSENTARQCEGTAKEQDQCSSMQLLAVLGPTAN